MISASGCKTFLFALAATGLLFAGSAGAEVLTLAQTFERMLRSEIEFEVLNLEQDVAAELGRQARGGLRPRVSLSLEANFINQNVISSDNKSYAAGKNSYTTYRLALVVTQPLYDPARWRQLALSDAQRELTRIRAEQIRNDLVGQMVEAFLDVGQAQLILNRSKSVIAARREFVELIHARVEAGRADLGTSLRAEGEILSAEGDVTLAEMQLTEALFALSRYAGGEVTGISLSDNRLGLVGTAELRATLNADRLLELNPQIQIARAEVLVAQMVLRSTKAGRLPTVNLLAETEIDNTDGSLFGGGSQISSTKVGVGIEVPLYQGGVQSSRQREDALRVEIAERRLELATRIAKQQYEALIAAEARAASRVGLLGRQHSAAIEALRVVEIEEQAGRVGADVVLESRLNADVLALELQAAQLQQLRLQMKLYALFGALDVEALSREISG